MPVLISNFKDINNEEPNHDTFINYETSRLVHRFFIYDTISGIETLGGYQSKSQPKFVRYASSVRLSVMLDETMEERILKPVL